jgi:hypothetical protein
MPSWWMPPLPTIRCWLNDFVLLPTMNVTGHRRSGRPGTGHAEPDRGVPDPSDTDNATVMTATMHSGGMMAVGTNTVAYSQISDDLDIGSYNENYGIVIPALADLRDRDSSWI